MKCQQLLRELKGTVEGLLVSQVPNVWSVFGGLNRLHAAVEKIFKHACTGCLEEVHCFFFRLESKEIFAFILFNLFGFLLKINPTVLFIVK